MILYGNVLTSQESARLAMIQNFYEGRDHDCEWLISLLKRFADKVAEYESSDSSIQKQPYNDRNIAYPLEDNHSWKTEFI